MNDEPSNELAQQVARETSNKVFGDLINELPGYIWCRSDGYLGWQRQVLMHVLKLMVWDFLYMLITFAFFRTCCKIFWQSIVSTDKRRDVQTLTFCVVALFVSLAYTGGCIVIILTLACIIFGIFEKQRGPCPLCPSSDCFNDVAMSEMVSPFLFLCVVVLMKTEYAIQTTVKLMVRDSIGEFPIFEKKFGKYNKELNDMAEDCRSKYSGKPLWDDVKGLKKNHPKAKQLRRLSSILREFVENVSEHSEPFFKRPCFVILVPLFVAFAPTAGRLFHHGKTMPVNGECWARIALWIIYPILMGSATIVYCMFAANRMWCFQKHLLFVRFFLLNSTKNKHTREILRVTFQSSFKGHVKESNQGEIRERVNNVHDFLLLRRLLIIGLTSDRVRLQLTFGVNFIIFCILCAGGFAIGELSIFDGISHWGTNAFCLIVSLVALWEVVLVSFCAIAANDVLKTDTLVVLRDWHEKVWFNIQDSDSANMQETREEASDIDRAIKHVENDEAPFSFYGIPFTRHKVAALLLSSGSMFFSAMVSYVKDWDE